MKVYGLAILLLLSFHCHGQEWSIGFQVRDGWGRNVWIAISEDGKAKVLSNEARKYQCTVQIGAEAGAQLWKLSASVKEEYKAYQEVSFKNFCKDNTVYNIILNDKDSKISITHVDEWSCSGGKVLSDNLRELSEALQNIVRAHEYCGTEGR